MCPSFSQREYNIDENSKAVWSYYDIFFPIIAIFQKGQTWFQNKNFALWSKLTSDHPTVVRNSDNILSVLLKKFPRRDFDYWIWDCSAMCIKMEWTVLRIIAINGITRQQKNTSYELKEHISTKRQERRRILLRFYFVHLFIQVPFFIKISIVRVKWSSDRQSGIVQFYDFFSQFFNSFIHLEEFPHKRSFLFLPWDY